MILIPRVAIVDARRVPEDPFGLIDVTRVPLQQKITGLRGRASSRLFRRLGIPAVKTEFFLPI